MTDVVKTPAGRGDFSLRGIAKRLVLALCPPVRRMRDHREALVVEVNRLTAEHDELAAGRDRLVTEHERLTAEHERLAAECGAVVAKSDRMADGLWGLSDNILNHYVLSAPSQQNVIDSSRPISPN